MSGAIGNLLLWLALALTALQLLLLLAKKPVAIVSYLPALVFLTLSGALAILIMALVQHDFSLAYVVSHSSVRLPLLYRVTAAWGGHEGSLLLWIALQAGWIAAFSLSRSIQPATLKRLGLVFMALVSLGMQLLLLLSSPFVSTVGDIPLDGKGLNPMLQDAALAVHPPALYLGYAGATVIFGIALAAMWLQLPSEKWIAIMRRHLLLCWTFLTAGIVLGSQWAYIELGWGGWWFWDPAENASLMPWLTITALIHQLLLCKRWPEAIKGVVLLTITSLALVLVGMFIVRSGVLSSVHAFIVNPARGIAILALLMLTAGTGFTLYGIRPPVISKALTLPRKINIPLLIVVLCLLVACATVILGTVYPIIIMAAGLGSISVGAAYFNTFFVPLALLMGATFWLSPGRKDSCIKNLVLQFTGCAALALAVTYTVIAFNWTAWAAVTISLLVLTASFSRWKQGYSFASCLTHAGLGLAIAGSAFSMIGMQQTEQRLYPWQSAQLGQYQVEFGGTTPRMVNNYLSDYAFFDVTREDKTDTVISEKRFYPYFDLALTEVGIKSSVFEDVYIALGQPYGDGSWSVRIKLIPFISLLWGGALLMILGGLLTLLPTRQSITTHTSFQDKLHAIHTGERYEH
ncbi:heme lyase CcmF/NrfE family subunit [Endozoicomonadaceae bacterium StTr2]